MIITRTPLRVSFFEAELLLSITLRTCGVVASPAGSQLRLWRRTHQAHHGRLDQKIPVALTPIQLLRLRRNTYESSTRR
jgi:hypothetical protein